MVPEPGAIMYGTDAGEDEFRYMVAMVAFDNRKKIDDVYSAGSILDERWIITARHVVINPDTKMIENFEVVPKYGNKIEKITSSKSKRYKMSKIFCTPPEDDADLALLKLSEPIPLKKSPDYFEKVLLPNKMNWSLDIWAAGWGFKHGIGSSKFDAAITLQKGKLYNLSEQCSSSCKVFHIKATNKVATCIGDSGGPAIIRNQGTSGDELVGVISGGKQFCQ
ncbi:prothrombin-like [Brevipalpus obovatus]|uniref:prothrombin-like n=1 Tax=Brevipalpus obovatus TaxID=246614 RepID=UPI003D9EBAED